MLVAGYQNTPSHIPEDNNLHLFQYSDFEVMAMNLKLHNRRKFGMISAFFWDITQRRAEIY
jgi:hypothetical protein